MTTPHIQPTGRSLLRTTPSLETRAAQRAFLTKYIRPLLLVVLTVLAALSVQAQSGPCGPPVTSVVACENTLPGDPPNDWQVNGAGDPSIQGFATQMSVTPGQTEFFKINTPAGSYHIDILRVGYYEGNGARKVVSNMQPTATLPQPQPACQNDSGPTGLIDCGNWAVSASWMVPLDAVSGLYLAHLVRNDTGGSSLIPFVVRDDASHSDILFQTDDETWQAYNSQGGNSLYTCTINCPPGNPKGYKGAAKVSYNRPWHSAVDDNGASWFMYAEYPMIRFLERNGYDVSYTSGVDVSQPAYASIIEQHKIFMDAGHDEYWSGQQGQQGNVTAARDAGVNLAFFSGNEMFWKTRWSPSIAGPNTPFRTLVCYKETHFDAPVDPLDPPTWTGTWMDPRFSPPADGGLPQNALTGQLFDVNSGTTDITVPSQYSKLRFWRNTAVAGLPPGDSITLDAGVGTLGYEWDVDADNGFRPPGLFDISATTNTSAEVFTDYGSNTQPNSTATHHLTLYRAASGALVFGAGTVQWSWGLDNGTGSGNSGGPVDPVMQQATINLFADMGNVQPATLTDGLPATKTTDTSPPTATITSPSPGATFSDGAAVTISGTATDAGGGVVAGVEVSTDSGSSWHPATTMSPAHASVTWSYSWIAHGYPTTMINARAVDDSGNLGQPTQGDTVNVTCPCSIWGTNVTPEVIDVANDTNAVNLGVKFQGSIPGTVTGIRFHKAIANTGTHIGQLWTATGQLLASATFTNETASGWQAVDFSQPVTIDANTTYIASYFAPNGHYSANNAYFYTTPPMGTNPTITTVNSPPLQAPRNTNGTVNGVYSYGGSPAFPTDTFDASNYWVDPIFSPAPTPMPTPTPTPTPTTVMIKVRTKPGGVAFSVDGTPYSSPQQFTWAAGSSHTLATTSPQSGGTGVQYVWKKWSDNGAISHIVAPTTDKNYQAVFSTQYYLTMTAGTGGTVLPASGWRNAGQSVTVRARANAGFTFTGWSGTGTGSYTGPNNPASVTMGGPITENATFTRN